MEGLGRSRGRDGAHRPHDRLVAGEERTQRRLVEALQRPEQRPLGVDGRVEPDRVDEVDGPRHDALAPERPRRRSGRGRTARRWRAEPAVATEAVLGDAGVEGLQLPAGGLDRGLLGRSAGSPGSTTGPAPAMELARRRVCSSAVLFSDGVTRPMFGSAPVVAAWASSRREYSSGRPIRWPNSCGARPASSSLANQWDESDRPPVLPVCAPGMISIVASSFDDTGIGRNVMRSGEFFDPGATSFAWKPVPDPGDVGDPLRLRRRHPPLQLGDLLDAYFFGLRGSLASGSTPLRGTTFVEPLAKDPRNPRSTPPRRSPSCSGGCRRRSRSGSATSAGSGTASGQRTWLPARRTPRCGSRSCPSPVSSNEDATHRDHPGRGHGQHGWTVGLVPLVLGRRGRRSRSARVRPPHRPARRVLVAGRGPGGDDRSRAEHRERCQPTLNNTALEHATAPRQRHRRRRTGGRPGRSGRPREEGRGRGRPREAAGARRQRHPVRPPGRQRVRLSSPSSSPTTRPAPPSLAGKGVVAWAVDLVNAVGLDTSVDAERTLFWALQVALRGAVASVPRQQPVDHGVDGLRPEACDLPKPSIGHDHPVQSRHLAPYLKHIAASVCRPVGGRVSDA